LISNWQASHAAPDVTEPAAQPEFVARISAAHPGIKPGRDEKLPKKQYFSNDPGNCAHVRGRTIFPGCAALIRATAAESTRSVAYDRRLFVDDCF
jgi:hypothetical protein